MECFDYQKCKKPCTGVYSQPNCIQEILEDETYSAVVQVQRSLWNIEMDAFRCETLHLKELEGKKE